ncbi:hypothetical protein TWF730_002017 [Orbilia blumenaviensis]|uniref:Secreted protein n=1 Tax=Orbilia blumenaviensis TaxID=1796055 RepID=A0AAV9UCR8_9PEZI
MLRSTVLSLALLSCFAGLGYSRDVVTTFEDEPEYDTPVGVKGDILFSGFTVAENILNQDGGVAALARLPVNGDSDAPSLEIIYPDSTVESFQPQELSFGCLVDLPVTDTAPMMCKIRFTPYTKVTNPDGSESFQALATKEVESFPGVNTSDGLTKVTFDSSTPISRLVISISDANEFLANLLTSMGGEAHTSILINEIKYSVVDK